MRVVIVAGELFWQRRLRVQLRNLPVEVVGEATTAAEAARLVEVLDPDVVVLDPRLAGDIDELGSAPVVVASPAGTGDDEHDLPVPGRRHLLEVAMTLACATAAGRLSY